MFVKKIGKREIQSQRDREAGCFFSLYTANQASILPTMCFPEHYQGVVPEYRAIQGQDLSLSTDKYDTHSFLK